jgi:hypothetical protein
MDMEKPPDLKQIIFNYRDCWDESFLLIKILGAPIGTVKICHGLVNPQNNVFPFAWIEYENFCYSFGQYQQSDKTKLAVSASPTLFYNTMRVTSRSSYKMDYAMSMVKISGGPGPWRPDLIQMLNTLK